VRIQPVPNGAGVYLSQDCRTAYVLPPLKGSFQIAGMTVNENLRMCPAVESYMQVVSDQAARIQKISAALRAASGADEGDSGDDGSVLFPGKPKPAPANGEETTDLLARLKEAEDIFREVHETMKDYWQVEGSVGQGVMSAEQMALVDAYQKRNPGLRFLPMPISAAGLHFVRRVGGTDSLPVVLNFTVPGAAIPGDGTTGGTGEGSVMFGGILSGQLTLSLLGACPYYDVGSGRMKTQKLDGRSLAPYFTANVAYTYNLAAGRAYTASYNLASFFRRLQTQQSSGGFFSTSTVSRLIVEKNSTDWFRFTSHSDDPRQEFEDSLRSTVKAELIDRAFKQIALLAVGPGESAPALITPKANGASAAAGELHKCPYLYCQIGAGILDVGNAIFGKSEAVSEFIQRNDFWAKDDVSETKMLPFQGSTTFVENR
jgi:hypothetical protein